MGPKYFFWLSSGVQIFVDIFCTPCKNSRSLAFFLTVTIHLKLCSTLQKSNLAANGTLNEAWILWKELSWPLSNRETILHQMDLIEWKFVFTNVSWSVKQWKRGGASLFCYIWVVLTETNSEISVLKLTELARQGVPFHFSRIRRPLPEQLNYLLKPFFLKP